VVLVALLGPVLWLSPASTLPMQEGDRPALPEPQPTPEAARDEADRILSGSEFQTDGGEQGNLPGEGGSGPAPEPVDPPSMPTATPFAGLGAVGQVIVWLVLALLVALFGYALFRVVQSRSRRVREDGEDEDAGPVVVADEVDGIERTGDQWRRLALAAEAEGRWRDGLRCRYRALTAMLIEQRVLADVAGRTTGEQRSEVRVGVPDASPDFADAAELFDRSWYGNLPTGPEQRDRFVSDEERIVSTVAQAGARQPVADAVPRADPR